MTCSVAREMLGAYLDGELDANVEFEVRLHLSDCKDCAAAFERLRARQQLMRQGGFSYRAPESLESRIRKSLEPKRRIAGEWRRWAALAASLLLLSALSVRLWQRRSGMENQIGQQVVSSHLRALLTGHGTDVASTDRHTVKPWFNGRVDFSPPVADLAERGFPLVGGRIDYLNHRSVAVLVYQRRKHSIDLFIWPASEDRIRGNQSSNGYNVLFWSRGGMSYAAVSDLNAIELEQFKEFLPK
jgi:anti-sigma factor RsiW